MPSRPLSLQCHTAGSVSAQTLICSYRKLLAYMVTKKLTTYPLELLQLLGELLHRLGVLLPHLLDLGLVGPRLLVQGLLQHRHLLLPLGPGREEHSEWPLRGDRASLQTVLHTGMSALPGPRAEVSIASPPWLCDLGGVT